MFKLKKGISFIVLVIVLAGMMTTFVKVQGATTFSGYVENNEGNPVSGASVTLSDSYYNFLGFTTTNSEGYYSISVTLSGNSPYYLSASSNTRYYPETKKVYTGGTYNFELEAKPEKIAVFFYVTNACHPNTINRYIGILGGEGYTKFFKFENSLNVASACQTIDNYELYVDTIFVYIMGHGLNDGNHSYIDFKAGEGTYNVYSNEFRGYMNAWDAPRKCLLVDSCYSGDWADDFAASPYLAMSSTNETHEAKYRSGYSYIEGEFSYRFFDKISDGGTAVAAFNHASNYCSNRYPQKRDFSSYVWFN